MTGAHFTGHGMLEQPRVPTRKQLELAAKAAGKTIQGFYEEINESGVLTKRAVDIGEVACILWEPVTSTSDSFDLMVACKINVEHQDELGRVFAGDGSTLQMEEYKDHATEADATMWAAFLCAIKTGRAM